MDGLYRTTARTSPSASRLRSVALRGRVKGVVARTLGKIFGKHFAHIANGEQLTGRFNASLATSCLVFLDEALWAGDKKGEGVLKALITEPRLQLEAKFRDPIMVDNHSHIIVASNNDWFVPAGMGDRRWFILDVADTFAGTEHADYWNALYAEIENGGAEAMFHDLLNMDLSRFNVRAVPHTAAKAQQQAHSFRGMEAWVHHILQEGAIGSSLGRMTASPSEGRCLQAAMWISASNNAIGDQTSNPCGRKKSWNGSARASRVQGKKTPASGFVYSSLHRLPIAEVSLKPTFRISNGRSRTDRTELSPAPIR